VIVATFPMPAGSVFDWHTHPEHVVAAFRRETGLTPAAYFRNPD
jgi:hypothetical protein